MTFDIEPCTPAVEDETNKPAWVFDDGGRAGAGFKGTAGDCVVRAIAIATGLPYQKVYDDLFEANTQYAKTHRDDIAKHIARRGASPRRGGLPEIFEPYLKALGWDRIEIEIGSGIRLRREELPAGTLIVQVRRHLVAVIDGLIRDTHDCSNGGSREVLGYYVQNNDSVLTAVEVDPDVSEAKAIDQMEFDLGVSNIDITMKMGDRLIALKAKNKGRYDRYFKDGTFQHIDQDAASRCIKCAVFQPYRDSALLRTRPKRRTAAAILTNLGEEAYREAVNKGDITASITVVQAQDLWDRHRGKTDGKGGSKSGDNDDTDPSSKFDTHIRHGKRLFDDFDKTLKNDKREQLCVLFGIDRKFIDDLDRQRTEQRNIDTKVKERWANGAKLCCSEDIPNMNVRMLAMNRRPYCLSALTGSGPKAAIRLRMSAFPRGNDRFWGKQPCVYRAGKARFDPFADGPDQIASPEIAIADTNEVIASR